MAGRMIGLLLALALGTAGHSIHSSTLTIRDGVAPSALTAALRAFREDFPPGTDPVAIERYLGAVIASTAAC